MLTTFIQRNLGRNQVNELPVEALEGLLRLGRYDYNMFVSFRFCSSVLKALLARSTPDTTFIRWIEIADACFENRILNTREGHELGSRLEHARWFASIKCWDRVCITAAAAVAFDGGASVRRQGEALLLGLTAAAHLNSGYDKKALQR